MDRRFTVFCLTFLLRIHGLSLIHISNTYGGIYPQDIAMLQKDYADLWEPLSELLKKLSQVVEM